MAIGREKGDGHPNSASYEELQRQHRADAQSLLPEHVDRLSWSADRLHRERQERLRELVAVARGRSAWHRRRLAGIDPLRLTEAELGNIPPMTKADLMENWDETVTDPRLSLDLVNAHLERIETDEYLLGQYHAVASGGSSGRRGVFVYDWQGWMGVYLNVARLSQHQPGAEGGPSVLALLAAEKATHISSAYIQTFMDAPTSHRIPVTRPIERIVEELNRLQPTVLAGYPSALLLLVHEARAGRLDIAPGWIGGTAEPLLPEIRAALEETWGVQVGNAWGCSEGARATSCGRGRGMHLCDDLVIVEPVDQQGRPVPPGVPSAKVYLTNLFNRVLPLIRYELEDEMTFLDEPCPCGSAHRRIDDVQGRLDDLFRYGAGLQVHPHLFRSALGRQRNILEYQVRQTERGADVAVHCVGALDTPELHREISAGLTAAGLERPDLQIRRVKGLERLGTGKLKRFVPLESEGPTAARTPQAGTTSLL
ncbi:MAG: phenylacetate--CoA ligase family protein [Planctomycetota bacterium]